MTSSPLDFDCDFRRAASHEVVQIDQIVCQAMLEIYERPKGECSFTQSPFFAEIAVVGSEIIGVAAVVNDMLSCLYVVKRFRNSGVGTCLLHNAMLSGVRTALIPSGNDRVKTFFTHRGWYAGRGNPADGGYGIFPKVVMCCGVQNQKIKLS